MMTNNENNERMRSSAETSLHLAAEIHKQVRRDLKAQRVIRPGAKLVDIADFIETATKRHTSDLMISVSDPSAVTTINGGIGFPAGLSINSCAAHYHPYINDPTILSKNDIIKVDFGTEINGWIVDSAFTEYGFGENNLSKELSDTFGNLTACMRDATNTGIKNIGIDVPIVEWSQAIEEVMRSYGVCPISNLGGHNILHEIIHGDVFLPACAGSVRDASERFGAGVYAIETFGSTDNSDSDRDRDRDSDRRTVEVVEKGESAIFRLNPGFMRYSAAQLATQFHSPIFKIHSVQKLFSQIKTRFKTLPFADRYVRSSASAERTPLALLVKHEVLYSYPPLCVPSGYGYTAQFEHTVMLKESGGPPIVFSRGDDY